MSGGYAIMILAAGASSRMGEAKQLISYKGKALINHIIDESKIECISRTLVVLGAHADRISRSITSDNVEIIDNPNWQEGMSSSIRVGINKISEDSSIEGCIISLVDQPFINKKVFQSLIDTYKESWKDIVASDYGNTIGPPVFISRSYFNKLHHLKGDSGAKQIITQNQGDVAYIEFKKGIYDLDTQEDLSILSDK